MTTDLWRVIDIEIVRRRAARAQTLDLYSRPNSGAVFDALAKSVFDGIEDGSDESRFLGAMTDYFQNMTAETRWPYLVAIAKEFGADFKTLGKYLRDHGVFVRVRQPGQNR
jgi:hypothetical protein